MDAWKRLDAKFSSGKGSALWQFVKFNIVSLSVTVVQLLLANLLPLVFDAVTAPLPPLLRPIFNAGMLFDGESKYVVDGVVTWGYVLPFLLSNGIANVYGYFVNMKKTFRGKGTKGGFAAYVVILLALILFTTWLQGVITAALQGGALSALARTIAAAAAGLVQTLILFPLEKHVLFRSSDDKTKEG